MIDFIKVFYRSDQSHDRISYSIVLFQKKKKKNYKRSLKKSFCQNKLKTTFYFLGEYSITFCFFFFFERITSQSLSRHPQETVEQVK
jgi:hypothetical protein